jgi:hypothetical protein
MAPKNERSTGKRFIKKPTRYEVASDVDDVKLHTTASAKQVGQQS